MVRPEAGRYVRIPDNIPVYNNELHLALAQTYSMYGPPNSGPQFNASSRVPPRDPDQIGLIPRAIEEIFELVHNRSIRDFQVHCSFVQIYNENLYDMLR